MNKLLATLLATAAGATIVAAPAMAQSDSAGYRKAMQKIEADHKAAKQKCDALKKEDVCEEQADVMRARAEADAVAKYDNTPSNREAARRKLADAEYELAEEKCDTLKGDQQDSCMATAKSVRTAALADAKARNATTTTGASGAAGATAAGRDGRDGGLVATTDTKDPVKAAAVDKCEKQGNKTACLVENKDTASAADRTENAAERAGDKTRVAASTLGEKTKAAAAAVVDKTKQAAHTVAEKTGLAADRSRDTAENVGDKTRDTASTAADKTEKATDRAGARTASAMSDTAITTKVKAGLVAEPDLSALAIKVETEKGVVMLSGFVDSKAEADKAVKVAKGVEGVSKVKNSIKVK